MRSMLFSVVLVLALGSCKTSKGVRKCDAYGVLESTEYDIHAIHVQSQKKYIGFEVVKK